MQAQCQCCGNHTGQRRALRATRCFTPRSLTHHPASLSTVSAARTPYARSLPVDEIHARELRCPGKHQTDPPLRHPALWFPTPSRGKLGVVAKCPRRAGTFPAQRRTTSRACAALHPSRRWQRAGPRVTVPHAAPPELSKLQPDCTPAPATPHVGAGGFVVSLCEVCECYRPRCVCSPVGLPVFRHGVLVWP